MNMNFYFLAMPLFLMMMYIIGTRDYRVTRKGVTRIYGAKFYKILSAIFSITVGVMMLFESMHGIVQVFDNLLLHDESDSAWSVILAIVAIEAVVIVFYGLCLISANLGRKVRRNILTITTEE